MTRIIPVIFFFCLQTGTFAQDTEYARRVIRQLCSKECFGRGYVKDGLTKARNYIVSEIRKTGASPLFGKEYSQFFEHDVNVFSRCELAVEGRKLELGAEFIPRASSGSVKGKYTLYRKDSVTYSNGGGAPEIRLKRKLTYTVAGETHAPAVELLSRKLPDTLKIRTDIRSRLVKGFRSANIGAVIKGKSDSLLVLCAHYDHLGGIGKDVYFPGANDNASGVSMVLNLMKHYSAQQPEYTMVFIFFAGEEAGLLGSKYFVDHPPFPFGTIRFLVNLDLLGTGDDGIMVVNGAVFTSQMALLENVNATGRLVSQVKRRGKAANSDHYWFSEAGVPCFFIYTMGGISAYHDIYDRAETLPLTDYMDVMRLITGFFERI